MLTETHDQSSHAKVTRELFRFAERGVLLLVGSIALGCWGMMVIRLFSDIHPMCELATHPSLHMFFICTAVLVTECIVYFVRRRTSEASPRWMRRIAFTLIPFVFFGWVTTPWKLLPLQPSRQSEGSLKILSWNLLLVNNHFNEVIELVNREKPDIVALIEVSPLAEKELEILQTNYPYHLWMPAWQGSGIALMSRHSESTFRRVYPGGNWMPAIELELNRGESKGKLSVLAVHTLSPSPSESAKTVIRDLQLKGLGSWAGEKDHATMVIGDCNISPWSPPFWRLLKEGKLRDSRLYRGCFSSWPASFKALGIPIDHALVNDKIKILDRRIFYHDTHSDHCPISISIE